MYKVLNLFPNGEYTLTEQSKKPELRQLQNGVDGLIAPVDYFIRGKYITAYVNDEGWLRGMSHNFLASRFLKYPEPLAGPMVAYWKTTTKKANEWWAKFLEAQCIYMVNITETNKCV